MIYSRNDKIIDAILTLAVGYGVILSWWRQLFSNHYNTVFARDCA
jgi:hypothetical protein